MSSILQTAQHLTLSAPARHRISLLEAEMCMPEPCTKTRYDAKHPEPYIALLTFGRHNFSLLFLKRLRIVKYRLMKFMLLLPP